MNGGKAGDGILPRTGGSARDMTPPRAGNAPLTSGASGISGHSGLTDIAGRELQATVRELLWLVLAAKQLHWTVVGPLFLGVHRFFDELAASWMEHADLLGERCVAVGFWPNGQAGAITGDRDLTELEPGPVPDLEALKLLGDRVAVVVARCRGRIREVGSVDAITEGVLVGVAGTLEQQLWMLRAQQPADTPAGSEDGCAAGEHSGASSAGYLSDV